ncbi:MAG: hypothetical protein HUU28_08870 [Planctomycetaceae bacterium]|nr:hypothetical protein [Planctomycetaceae bacterium]
MEPAVLVELVVALHALVVQTHAPRPLGIRRDDELAVQRPARPVRRVELEPGRLALADSNGELRWTLGLARRPAPLLPEFERLREHQRPLRERRDSHLPLAGRKRLELARALATEPELLLLDEIAGGLTEGECRDLVETIRGIRAGGITIVWIEHIVHALLAVVGRLIVLDFGRKIAEGEPRAVMNSPEVQEIYMGIAA